MDLEVTDENPINPNGQGDSNEDTPKQASKKDREYTDGWQCAGQANDQVKVLSTPAASNSLATPSICCSHICICPSVPFKKKCSEPRHFLKIKIKIKIKASILFILSVGQFLHVVPLTSLLPSFVLRFLQLFCSLGSLSLLPL